ncbi:MAG TPA: DUF6265 family protein [Croceibacterium sp.]|nr:DUF6265 family protein [Croceibacterium sp.]
MKLPAAALAAVLALMPAAIAAEEEAAPLPAWMAGAWATSDDAGGWTEEVWSAGRGGMMLGTSRQGNDDGLLAWEVMRIRSRADGSIELIAQPAGGAPVVFELSGQGRAMIEFSNPTHDYPQRIRYWREGDALNAEIALLDGERAMTWAYSPMAE